jgi:hypothetical protein
MTGMRLPIHCMSITALGDAGLHVNSYEVAGRFVTMSSSILTP